MGEGGNHSIYLYIFEKNNLEKALEKAIIVYLSELRIGLMRMSNVLGTKA